MCKFYAYRPEINMYGGCNIDSVLNGNSLIFLEVYVYLNIYLLYDSEKLALQQYIRL